MRYLFPPRRSVRLHWVALSHDGRGVEATNSGNLTARNVYKGAGPRARRARGAGPLSGVIKAAGG